MEVTKSPKPSRQRAAWRPGDQAGRNASTRRAGLETTNAGADPAKSRGRPPSLTTREAVRIGRPMNDRSQRAHRVVTTACQHREIARNRGNPKW